MKLSEALKITDESYKRRRELRIKKCKDYAKDDDALKNFKNMSKILSTLKIDISKSYGIALVYVVLKIDRLCNLIFQKKEINPENESVLDTFDDLSNYIDLARENFIEEYNETKKINKAIK